MLAGPALHPQSTPSPLPETLYTHLGTCLAHIRCHSPVSSMCENTLELLALTPPIFISLLAFEVPSAQKTLCAGDSGIAWFPAHHCRAGPTQG